MKRKYNLTKMVIFVGVPFMAMLGNIVASKMCNKEQTTAISDLEITMNAIVFGAVTLLVVIVIACLQCVFLHLFESICRRHKQK